MIRNTRSWLATLAVAGLIAIPAPVLAEDAKPAADAKPAEKAAEGEKGCCCLRQKPNEDIWKCAPSLMPEARCEGAAGAYKVDHRWTAGACKKD